ncbi:MAG: hypothetical protein N2485_00680 [bacterium]|nr:hypothetical protein [bacterium]
MEIDLSKLQNDLYLKEVINNWYKNISSNKDSVVLDTLINIYKTILYIKKDEKLFNKFRIQFSSISKVVYNQIYTNVSLIRLYVVKIAYLMDYKDLIVDIMNYLKSENDIECLKEYLEFIKKYGYIGYIDEILNLLNKDKPFLVNIKVFEVVLYLALNYRNNSKYIDKAFEFLKSYYETNYPKWEHFFINFFEAFLDIIKYIDKNKEKFNAIFVFEYLNHFIYKALNFINSFISNIDDENKINIINLILLNLCFSLNIIKNIIGINKNLENYVADKLEDEKYFLKLNLLKITNDIYTNLSNNYALKYYFLANFVNNKEIFKGNLLNKKEEDSEILDSLLGKILQDFTKTENNRLKNVILDFIDEFDIVLNDNKLEAFTKELFLYDDNIILKMLNIIQKANYKIVINTLMKLLDSRNLEIVNKVKDIIKKE